LWSVAYDWGGLNIEAFRLINGAASAWMESAIIGMSAAGSYWGAPLLFLALLIRGWHLETNGHHDMAALTFRQLRRFVIGFVIAWIVVAFFKLTLNVPRPLAVMDGAVNVAGAPEFAFGFPSGHAAYTALAIWTVWTLLGRRGRIALVALGGLVAWARIASGAHFPADVVWGALLGGAAALVADRVTVAPRPSLWLALSAAIVGLDQLTKSAIIGGLEYSSQVPITSFFDLVHTRNTGAAFSLFADGTGWQTWFLAVFAVGVSAVLAWRLFKPLPRIEAASYCLIIGGALANGVDRAMNGYVTDFLSFYWRDYYWPAFNLADVAICGGAILLLSSTLLFDRQKAVPTGA
jgi:signal peptidase II